MDNQVSVHLPEKLEINHYQLSVKFLTSPVDGQSGVCPSTGEIKN